LYEPAEPIVEEAAPPAPEPAVALEEPKLREPAEPVMEEEEPVVDIVEADIAPEPIEPEVLEPVTGIAAFRQQLAVEPDDHVTRLALARTLLDDDILDKALAEYGELVAAGQELDDVTSDLERVMVSDLENTLAHRVLGDAYMKQNRLGKALEAYRQALGHLS
jgi:tetratricopeptide (TPR) repeat protein